MKQVVIRFAIVIFIGVLTASFYAQDFNAPPPVLRGEKAVDQLKNTSQYDGLKKAFDTARRKNGQTTEPTPENAVGQTAKLVSSDGAASDFFGASVAIQGNTAIVGASFDNSGQGSVYVFQLTGTTWIQDVKLTASDGAPGDNFGSSVAISGDTAVIGAPADGGGQGSAYVFVLSSGTWSQEQKLIAADGSVGDRFGASVAVYGDTAIIGANNDNIAFSKQGSAYVFERTGSTWTQVQQLTASAASANDNFGVSVAISGSTAIVGSNMDDVGSNSDQGSAYVFIYSGGAWTQQAQLTATSGPPGGQFGYSVSISGDTAIVGAYKDDPFANTDRGSAYVFTRSGSIWTQQAQLIASDGVAGDGFGGSVAISGDVAVVGAYADAVGSNGNQGSAYIFTRSGTTWTQTEHLTPSDGAANQFLGFSVAISGTNAIAGSPYDTVGANVAQGSAYIFRVLGTGWTQEAQEAASDGAGADHLGSSVAISGDTAVVGAPGDDAGANSDQGSAYVFVRSGAGWAEQAHLFATGGASGDNFGASVAIYRDTVIVGADKHDPGGNADQGSAYVFTRSGTTWTQQSELNASDGAAGDAFGFSVSIDGNTAIVGAHQHTVGGNANQGSAYVFVRSGTAWSQQAQFTASDGASGDHFGTSVAISGNTVIVGANLDDVGANADQGSAYVFVFSGSWTEQARLTASDGAGGDHFGTSVAISGETVIVGAEADDVAANADQGSAYVFTRAGSAWSEQAHLTASDGAGSDNFGVSVAISGDTAVVGSYFDGVGANTAQGSAYVFIRATGTWTQQSHLTATGGTANDDFGNSVAISGDKIVAGAPLSDVSASIPLAPQAADQGAAFFFVNGFIPTAAPVSITGCILAPNGYGLRNAFVDLTLASGETRRSISSSFGYFRFDGIEAGQTVVISVVSKRFHYAPQIVSTGEDITDLNFMPQ
ncbi:MAG TPA: FG-GAP repeat protein [Pyrinomonadaceae bacterium]|nr:FG-GAP repeat protein [Pyrinomonadaceae bacterium]